MLTNEKIEVNEVKKALIEHAAPTLAGLKTGNMFNYAFTTIEQLEEELLVLNQEFNKKGLYVEILRKRPKTVLLYVYRKNRLEETLKDVKIVELLESEGYVHPTDVAGCLAYLKQRLCSTDDFPHEIGIFLGYPIEDVVGFIKHCGLNCKCCGYWKVYGDEEKAQHLFSQFTKCREIYKQLYSMGKSINQLIVAA